MESSTFQSAKLVIMGATDMTKDALHIHVGIFAMLVTALFLRKSLASLLPWLVAFAVATAGELWDISDDIRYHERLRPGASIHDLANTMFWPTVLLLLAKTGRVGFKAGSKRDGDAA